MRIVSVTRTVPFDGIPHAGGEYALRHARALHELGHEVTFIAPDTEENRRAVERGGHHGDVVLYGDPTLEHPGPFERLRRRLSPARVSAAERRALARSSRAHVALAGAELVEFHWTQAADLRRVVTRHAPPHARRLIVLYDVMTQQVQRQRDTAAGGAAARIVRSLKVFAVRRAEKRAIAAVDVAVVFSEKDAIAATALAAGTAEVRVLRPPLAAATDIDAPPREPELEDGRSRPFTVLYVGWFRRPDNARAAEWLCREIWPSVRAVYPHARLILAGADPTAAMAEAAARDPSVSITGYRESLDEFYARANAAVIPLRQGAGVKFKTVLAMLWGVPVVSTSVGVEGITDSPELIWRQADDAAGLAAGLLAAAADPEGAARVARAAQIWAREEFSDETFHHRLARLIGEHPPAPSPS